MASESAREISEWSPIFMDEVAMTIEVRGIFDGWSVALMRDGRLLNRWPPDDRRHQPTQEWIAALAQQATGDKTPPTEEQT